MRTIKFKAKLIDGSEWIEFELLTHEVGIATDGVFYTDFGVGLDAETVCEYTGLKDKDSIEAYHKDIVQMGPFFFTIEWDDKAAKFYLKSTNSIDHMKYTMTHLPKNGVVVGNIHDNKELR